MPHTPHLTRGPQPEPVETPESGLVFTLHALKRMQQRAISREDVVLTLRYGREYHAGSGATAVVLGRRDVLRHRRDGVRLDACMNLSVILSGDGAILTVHHIERPPRSWRAA